MPGRSSSARSSRLRFGYGFISELENGRKRDGRTRRKGHWERRPMTELTAAEPLTGEIITGISPDDRGADDGGAVCAAVVAWLHTFESVKTRNAHASRLGLPAECRTWPGAPNPSKVTIDPNAWLPWCAARGLDPLAVPRQ